MTVSDTHRNKYARKWYAANKERILAKNRKHIKTAEQKEAHKIASQKYYKNNKIKCRESSKRWKELYFLREIRPAKNLTDEEILQNKRKSNKLWRDKNKQLNKEKDRLKYLRRKPIIQQRNKENREVINKKYLEHTNKRFKSDPLFKLSRNVPKLLRISIKRAGFSKKSKTYQILGCTFEEFKTHIENKFEHWMNWDNYGKYDGSIGYGWEFDHIIPVSSATSEEEIIKLNHYSNFQPLDGFTNRYIKRNKVA